MIRRGGLKVVMINWIQITISSRMKESAGVQHNTSSIVCIRYTAQTGAALGAEGGTGTWHMCTSSCIAYYLPCRNHGKRMGKFVVQ